MFDRDIVLDILRQIRDAIETIRKRTEPISSASDFTHSAWGMEKLDSVCMLFIAIGESVKNIDKMTSGHLLPRYPQVDWTGVMGFRDIVAHHYFDIDAEQVFWICHNELAALADTVQKMIQELAEESREL
jgi:uncharacterized protein with HEPN domain